MGNLSVTKKKILLLLAGGATLCLVRSPKQYFKILKTMGRGWEKIKKEEIRDKIRELYQSKLVKIETGLDGMMKITLSSKGKNKVLKFNFDDMKIEKHYWDEKWRMVIFDIPENIKAARDALRFKLKKLGFHELQKSVFVYPFNCEDEINFIAEFFGVKPYVRYGVLESIDNALHLKKIFDL